MSRLRVGVIGCGLIAQVMHLPHLRELNEEFEICALCDLSSGVLARVASKYCVQDTDTEWQNLIARSDIDAVLILTGGDHAPLILAALEAGKHVFVEKPMCFSLREADHVIEASLRLNLCIMVGYMKWFDPAYQEAKSLLNVNTLPRLVQMTKVEQPEEVFYQHHRLYRSNDLLDQGLARSRRAESLAGELPDISSQMRDAYVDVLLDSAVHDLYVLRGLFGDPKHLVHSHFWARGKAFQISWHYAEDMEAHYSYAMLDYPGGRYKETLVAYGAEQRLILDFPSPYLRDVPTELIVEERKDGATTRCHYECSFEEAFKRELLHFAECVASGMSPLSSALEGRKDIAIMQDVIREAFRQGQAL